MSISGETKYDLCADTVSLDYAELLKTAKIAVRYSFESLNDSLKEWRTLGGCPTNLHAEWMLQDAQALATATTTLHVLSEGLTRDVVVVVNKAQLKEAKDA